MPQTPADLLADFFEQNPACYHISGSSLFMNVLRSIIAGPKAISELASEHNSIDPEDLRLVVSALQTAGLVFKPKNIQKEFYSPTEKASKFLELLGNAKTFYE